MSSGDRFVSRFRLAFEGPEGHETAPPTSAASEVGIASGPQRQWACANPIRDYAVASAATSVLLGARNPGAESVSRHLADPLFALNSTPVARARGPLLAFSCVAAIAENEYRHINSALPLAKGFPNFAGTLPLPQASDPLFRRLCGCRASERIRASHYRRF